LGGGGFGRDCSGGHQGKGLAVALQAHQQLAVGPKVGLAIGGGQGDLVGQELVELQGFVELVEVPQAAGQAATADGAVGLKGQGSAVAAMGGFRQVGQPQGIGLVGQEAVV